MQGTLPPRLWPFLARFKPISTPRGLAALTRALDQAPRPVCFWWRDDDAGRPHPRLDQLLALADRLDLPVGLSVVPQWLQPRVIERIRAGSMAQVLQHGWAHEDNAEPGCTPVEIGGRLPTPLLKEQLARGRSTLERAFGPRFVPILVPPWNLIDQRCTALVDEAGYTALSSAPHIAMPGLRTRRLDCHVDLVDWQAYLRHFPRIVPLCRWAYRNRGLGSVAAEIATWIETGRAAPIGILTHHLMMPPPAFAALERLLALLRDHRTTRWLSPAEIVGTGPAKAPIDRALRAGRPARA